MKSPFTVPKASPSGPLRRVRTADEGPASAMKPAELGLGVPRGARARALSAVDYDAAVQSRAASARGSAVIRSLMGKAAAIGQTT